jgi:F5/8 type C domain
VSKKLALAGVLVVLMILTVSLYSASSSSATTRYKTLRYRIISHHATFVVVRGHHRMLVVRDHRRYTREGGVYYRVVRRGRHSVLLRRVASASTIAPAAVLTGVPVSIGLPATASSASAGALPWAANDGQTTTRWAAASPQTYPQWWMVDLGTPTTVHGVKTSWYGNKRAYRYRVETSLDGVTFTVAADRSRNQTKGTTTDAVTAVARYVRVSVLSVNPAGVSASAYEITVNGDAGLPPQPTPEPTPEPTPTSGPTPTATPTEAPTPSPTPEPTSSTVPTPTPSPPPTPTPSPAPTTTPSPAPTTTPVPGPVEPDLLSRRDLIYGSEIGCWQVTGKPAVDPTTVIPSKIIAARIPVIRFAVYDVFTDMTDPNGDPGTIRRSDFDNAISGIVNTLHAVPWIKLLPVARDAIDVKLGTVFVPPLTNLGRDLEIHKAILAEVRKVYGGPIIVESDNEAEFDSYKIWGFANGGSVGVSKALGDKYVATMPALKKYARDVLGFSQVVTVGYVGVSGGPGWGQRITADATKPYGYSCGYQARWIDEFNTAIQAAYAAHGNDPDYIPDVESIHAYPHSPDFSDQAGYELDDNQIYAYYRNWLVQSRRRLAAIWGPTVGDKIRFSISEWNAGSHNTDGTWSGWSTPSRVQAFYNGWLTMLQGDGTTTGAGTRYWNANVFELASEAPTGYGAYYNLVRKDGTTPAWYDTFKAISTSDPDR